jgi:PadR family transcriptional regulator
MQYMPMRLFEREVKKGSAELLLLALLEERPRHGYELARLIETRSGGAISFRVPSLYPMLYRLERRGRIEGRWVEKAGQRRRRYYRITAQGRRLLARQRSLWSEFVRALDRVAGVRPA